MKELRRNFERFCYRNQNKGIPNLMLYVILGNVIVYLFMGADPSGQLYDMLTFDRAMIFSGQVWRLFTYIFLPETNKLLYVAIMLFFYFQIGRILEARWGTFRFNLYYFTGVLLMDVAGLILNAPASSYELNLSLILAFATTCPEDRVLLFYIIPLKMKYLAWYYFATTAFTLIVSPMYYKIFTLVALGNYFLFMGSEIKGVLPNFGYYRPASKPKQKASSQPNANWAAGYHNAKGEPAYRHKCEVCGRTDTQFPELEFRYCSQCSGYHCYCMEHINNHEHVKD